MDGDERCPDGCRAARHAGGHAGVRWRAEGWAEDVEAIESAHRGHARQRRRSGPTRNPRTRPRRLSAQGERGRDAHVESIERGCGPGWQRRVLTDVDEARRETARTCRSIWGLTCCAFNEILGLTNPQKFEFGCYSRNYIGPSLVCFRTEWTILE